MSNRHRLFNPQSLNLMKGVMLWRTELRKNVWMTLLWLTHRTPFGLDRALSPLGAIGRDPGWLAFCGLRHPHAETSGRTGSLKCITRSSVTTVLAALAVHDAENIGRHAEIATALIAEASLGFRDAFLPHIAHMIVSMDSQGSVQPDADRPSESMRLDGRTSQGQMRITKSAQEPFSACHHHLLPLCYPIL